MDVLEKLTPEQRTLIVSLPYRAGLWVSESDQDGGDEAQEKEMTALANITEGFAEQVFGSELLQYIMDETVKGKAQWQGSWAENLDKVPEECTQALNILREHVDEKEVNAFSTRLMEIGEAVAVAFREGEGPSGLKKFMVYMKYSYAAYKARVAEQAPKSFDQYLNVSMSERKALNALAAALGTQYYM